MRRKKSFLTVPFFVSVIIFTTIRSSGADFWDDFLKRVHEGLVDGADYIKDTAGPAVRKKFNEAKETLQDPDTHEKVQEWLKDKFLKFKKFVNEDVVPEVQKIVEAASEAAKRSSKKSDDS